MIIGVSQMSKGVIFNNNTGPVTILNENGFARPSILGKLIEIIAKSDQQPMNLDRMPVDIDVKIQFNDLKYHNWIISGYANSSLLIDDSIETLNQTILNGSTKLKRTMKEFYLGALTKYSICQEPFDLQKLRINSDAIVSDVILSVTNLVKNSSDLKEGYFEEDIQIGINLIISYSIIECIVLENPNDHN